MPKAPKMKYYAVRNGRQGARIYTSWNETNENVSRYPGAVHKSFKTISQAEDWLATALDMTPMTDIKPPESSLPMSAPDPNRPWRKGNKSRSPEVTPSSSLTPAEVESSRAPDAKINLSAEQIQVLDKVKAGKNVFFTGSAGTGKSVLLREIIKYCGGPSPMLAVTASTGIASVNIGGSTIHSWAGIGLGKESAEKLVGKLLGLDRRQRQLEEEMKRSGLAMSNQTEDERIQTLVEQDRQEAGLLTARSQDVPRVVERWRKVRTLIVDEISMMDGILFDKLEFIARVLRGNGKPFGGIQLVLSGDFCQLPPVPGRDAKGAPLPATFAFEANSWSKCIERPIVLRHVFRQKEKAFVDMLNAMRLGQLSEDAAVKFRALSRPVIYEDGIEPTDLFPTRREVDNANASRLNRLPGPCHTYPATDTGGIDLAGMPLPTSKVEALLDRLIAPRTIALKVGAQVMLIKNLVQGELVNGSVGRIVGFSTSRDALKKGMAIAQTESQNDAGRDKPIVPEETYRSTHVWPVVQFEGGRTLLCIPSTFDVNNADGQMEARREQIPLILAWALSIHKSQGQTLQRVRVNLSRIFEKGQAYVALSRATSMDTLQVLNFDQTKVMAHERVLNWMNRIEGHNGPAQMQVGLYDDEDDEDAEYWKE